MLRKIQKKVAKTQRTILDVQVTLRELVVLAGLGVAAYQEVKEQAKKFAPPAPQLQTYSDPLAPPAPVDQLKALRDRKKR